LSKEFLIVFGKKLKRLRKDMGITQKEMGYILLVSDRMVSRYEKGKSCMNIEQLNRLIKEIGCRRARFLFKE